MMLYLFCVAVIPYRLLTLNCSCSEEKDQWLRGVLLDAGATGHTGGMFSIISAPNL